MLVCDHAFSSVAFSTHAHSVTLSSLAALLYMWLKVSEVSAYPLYIHCATDYLYCSGELDMAYLLFKGL